MSKRTKALDISTKTKQAVWERDNHKCIYCGNHQAMPNSHVIPRSKGGLGIEQNIVTHCIECHRKMDQGIKNERDAVKQHAIGYIKRIYPGWTEEKVIYKK